MKPKKEPANFLKFSLWRYPGATASWPSNTKRGKMNQKIRFRGVVEDLSGLGDRGPGFKTGLDH
jgi:hypothetical protein